MSRYDLAPSEWARYDCAEDHLIEWATTNDDTCTTQHTPKGTP